MPDANGAEDDSTFYPSFNIEACDNKWCNYNGVCSLYVEEYPKDDGPSVIRNKKMVEDYGNRKEKLDSDWNGENWLDAVESGNKMEGEVIKKSNVKWGTRRIPHRINALVLDRHTKSIYSKKAFAKKKRKKRFDQELDNFYPDRDHEKIKAQINSNSPVNYGNNENIKSEKEDEKGKKSVILCSCYDGYSGDFCEY